MLLVSFFPSREIEIQIGKATIYSWDASHYDDLIKYVSLLDFANFKLQLISKKDEVLAVYYLKYILNQLNWVRFLSIFQFQGYPNATGEEKNKLAKINVYFSKGPIRIEEIKEIPKYQVHKTLITLETYSG